MLQGIGFGIHYIYLYIFTIYLKAQYVCMNC